MTMRSAKSLSVSSSYRAWSCHRLHCTDGPPLVQPNERGGIRGVLCPLGPARRLVRFINPGRMPSFGVRSVPEKASLGPLPTQPDSVST